MKTFKNILCHLMAQVLRICTEPSCRPPTKKCSISTMGQKASSPGVYMLYIDFNRDNFFKNLVPETIQPCRKLLLKDPYQVAHIMFYHCQEHLGKPDVVEVKWGRSQDFFRAEVLNRNNHSKLSVFIQQPKYGNSIN